MLRLKSAPVLEAAVGARCYRRPAVYLTSCPHHFLWSYYKLFSNYTTAVLIILTSALLRNKITYGTGTVALIVPSRLTEDVVDRICAVSVTRHGERAQSLLSWPNVRERQLAPVRLFWPRTEGIYAEMRLSFYRGRGG